MRLLAFIGAAIVFASPVWAEDMDKARLKAQVDELQFLLSQRRDQVIQDEEKLAAAEAQKATLIQWLKDAQNKECKAEGK